MINQRIRIIRRRKLIFFLGSLAALLAFLTLVPNMLVSFILAFVGTNLLSPVVSLLERRGLSRTKATLVPFLAFSLGIFILAQIFLPTLVGQIGSLKEDLPRYVEGAKALLGGWQNLASGYIPAETIQDLSQQVQGKGASWAHEILDRLPSHVSSSLTILFLAPFLCFFMLQDGRDWTRKLLSLVPNQIFEMTLNLQHQISTQMGGFIRARLIESLVVGALTAFGLFLMGFPYALVLALVAALLNLIPYIGPVIGALPAFFIAMVNGADSSTFLGLTLVYGGAQLIDAVVLVPFLVAKIVNLHPVTVVLSIIVGSEMMGVLGMIISIPVTSALKVILIALYQHLTDFRDGSRSENF